MLRSNFPRSLKSLWMNKTSPRVSTMVGYILNSSAVSMGCHSQESWPTHSYTLDWKNRDTMKHAQQQACGATSCKAEETNIYSGIDKTLLIFMITRRFYLMDVWLVCACARMTDGSICFVFASHVDPIWGIDYNRICTPSQMHSICF